MRAMIVASTLALVVAACSGSETRDEEPWGNEDPDDSTEAFDERLRQKRIADAESMEKAQAVAARLAAKRGKSLEETTGSSGRSPGRSVTRAVPQALDREPCPTDPNLKYTCSCTGGSRPSWAARTKEPAWQMPDGYWYAVGTAPAMKDPSMTSDRAYGRALTKIGSALSGQPGFSDAPPTQIKAFLKAAESREVQLTPGGGVSVLARYKPGGAVPKEVIDAKCPELGKAPYACNCSGGKLPAWLFLRVWRGGDGFAYAVGSIPGDSEHPESRIEGRANRNLMQFLSGLTLQAGPVPGGGKSIRSHSVGSINTKRVQKVAEQDHGGNKYRLVRFWIGE